MIEFKFADKFKQLAVWVIDGKTNKEIGKILNLHPNSVSVMKQNKEYCNLMIIYQYNKKRFEEIINEEI